MPILPLSNPTKFKLSEMDLQALREKVGTTFHINKEVMQANSYNPRFSRFEGREHIIVPVVMMVEGVHSGSHGPVLHLGAELGHFTASWNGIPVVVHHPTNEAGSGISANSPAIVENDVVGRIYNAQFTDNKLKAEAWLDVQRLSTVSPEALSFIKQKKPLDVSVGVFTDDEPTSGEFNSEQYSAIARNHRPDHLALLPGERGACSWADGCGVRTNKEGGPLEKKDVDVLIQTLKAGFREIGRNIQSLLDARDTETAIHYLEEVYDGYYVYRVENRNSNERKVYQVGYTASADGQITVADSQIEVMKKTEYVPVTQTNEQGGVKTMAKKTPCCPEKVELLIQSAHFTEDNREWLNGMDDKQIDSLINLNKAADKAPEKVEVEVPVQMNTDQVSKYLADTISDPAQFMNLLPAEMKEQMEHGMRMYKDLRTGLISSIATNSNGTYTQEDLKDMHTDQLKKLATFIKVPVDYSLQANNGQSIQQNSNEVAPMLPAGVEVDKA